LERTANPSTSITTRFREGDDVLQLSQCRFENPHSGSAVACMVNWSQFVALSRPVMTFSLTFGVQRIPCLTDTSVAGFQIDVCFLFKKDVFYTSFITKSMVKKGNRMECPQLVCPNLIYTNSSSEPFTGTFSPCFTSIIWASLVKVASSPACQDPDY
jgi:hypothetical protein